MAELKDFLYKPIKTDKIKILSSLKSNFRIIYHSLLPHSFPEEPKEKITIDSIKKKDVDLIYESSLEIYKDSKERIKALENKAFNLMTYISAITAILIFLLNKEINTLTKIFTIISILILLLALLLSLRCIGIKIQKTLFINSMFEFGEKSPKSKDKKHISVELINNSLFNQNIADNTTDILRASRILLFYGIIFSSISFFTYIISNNNNNVRERQIEFIHSKYIDSVYNVYENNRSIEFKHLSNKMDSIFNSYEKNSTTRLNEFNDKPNSNKVKTEK